MTYPTLLGLLAFSLITTYVSRWIVSRFRHSIDDAGRTLSAISADLIWVLLILAAGVIAGRYIERVDHAFVGYLAFGCVGFMLSLLRAVLYELARQDRKGERAADSPAWLRDATHNLGYVLFSALVYLISSLAAEGPANPVLLIPVCVGSLLPDLDSRDSLPGRMLPFVSRWLAGRLGQCQEWHSLGANLLVAAVSAPFIPLIGLPAWLLISAGFLSHLILDLLRPQGIMLLWPLSHTRFFVFRGYLGSPGDRAERGLVALLAGATIILLAVADVGLPTPPPPAAPSFERTVEYSLSLRGRNLVLADVDGTWQATGRRVSARFEILNTVDRSFIMLDRYSGDVFTAGRTRAENLYLNTVRITAGSPVQVKPVEVHLQNQPLGEALPSVYEMQREAGLQHIFVSGQLILSSIPDPSDIGVSLLQTQTRLPRIQRVGDRRFSLQYLSASDLVKLARVPVETGNLVIVATYTTPATGPTATALPSPPPSSGEAP